MADTSPCTPAGGRCRLEQLQADTAQLERALPDLEAAIGLAMEEALLARGRRRLVELKLKEARGHTRQAQNRIARLRHNWRLRSLQFGQVGCFLVPAGAMLMGCWAFGISLFSLGLFVGAIVCVATGCLIARGEVIQ